MKKDASVFDSRASWIWINDCPQKNEFARFAGEFCTTGGRTVIRISAETDYILRVNDKIVSFGQFAGYPFEKYYDELDITEYSRNGSNTFSITVRYEGVNSATHIDDGAGVIYTVISGGHTVAYSSPETCGGYDNSYIQHCKRNITVQLGLTCGMRNDTSFTADRCVAVDKTRNLKKRPVKKSALHPLIKGEPIAQNSNVYDLGMEITGYLYVKFNTEIPCTAKIIYGEHIADGAVRQCIGGRDFSLDFELTEGQQEFTQFFVRVGARYLQAVLPDGAGIMEIGIVPTLYPVTEKKTSLQGPDKRIYDTCVRTLRLCMGNHYEDCPWREQALYVLDARNQMLCGYYAFEETEYQRANLVFISKGLRSDGFLELTYPAVNTPAIPFFSVMYPVAVYEYIAHTGDESILNETMKTMLCLMNNFKARIEPCGLIADFESPFWNFYEWLDGNDGFDDPGSIKAGDKKYHLILNCAFIYSAERFLKLCRLAGVSFDIDIAALKQSVRNTFFDREVGLFHTSTGKREHYTALGNAFALLIGLGDAGTVTAIKEEKAAPATLSMLGYVYDALLMQDESNKQYVLEDIRKKYGYMLSRNATSFWETLEGESAFGGAGSLCHGWSAMPIYYFNILKDEYGI